MVPICTHSQSHSILRYVSSRVVFQRACCLQPWGLLGIEFQKHNEHNGLASSWRVMRQDSFLVLHSEDYSLITGGMPLPLPSLESWHFLPWCLPWSWFPRRDLPPRVFKS